MPPEYKPSLIDIIQNQGTGKDQNQDTEKNEPVYLVNAAGIPLFHDNPLDSLRIAEHCLKKISKPRNQLAVAMFWWQVYQRTEHEEIRNFCRQLLTTLAKSSQSSIHEVAIGFGLLTQPITTTPQLSKQVTSLILQILEKDPDELSEELRKDYRANVPENEKQHFDALYELAATISRCEFDPLFQLTKEKLQHHHANAT